MLALPRASVPVAIRQLILGLSLVVLALGLLAYWTWQSSVRRHRVAVDLLRSHAELAAQRLGDRIQNEIYVAAMAVFGPLTIRIDRRPGTILAREILDAANTAAACNCVPPLRPAYAFSTDLTAAETNFAGVQIPAEREQAAIVAALSDQLARMPRGWHVAVLRGSPALAGRLVIFTRAALEGTRPVYFGVATDSATFRETIVRPLLCNTRLVASDRTDTIPNDSLVAVSIADAAGTSFYRTPSRPDASLTSSIRFQPEWGALSVTASLSPQAAALVLPGGIPRSPVRVVLALILVSSALVSIAALLMWRMYELTRLRADFASSVSHELRTPLTQILLYAETIEMGRQRSEEKRAQAIAVITRETRRLIHLVENVLQFSRAERSLTQLRLQRHELGVIVAETVAAFQPVAESRGMNITLSLDGPVHARVDADAIRRMLLNLLDNAVRYGPTGQTITVSAAKLGDRARIAVEDEGPGVPRDRREAIWRPFVRLDDATAAPGTGCGIGLAIVSELVTLHGGHRGVDPRAGRGASFFVELPAA